MRNVIYKIYNTLFDDSSSADFKKLLREAENFPRYTPHQFHFRGLELNVTDFLSVVWQLKEIFIDEEMKFISTKKNPCIIDCGSNVGVSVIYFRKLFLQAKIIAFEPDPAIFNCLTKNLQANEVDGVNVIAKAVWINDEGVSFGADGADGGSIFNEQSKILIDSIRLKDVLESEAEIDLLKMDIEGAEVEVLLDCAPELKKVKNIYVEYHSWKNQPQQLDRLLNVLSGAGFRYFIRSISHTNANPFVENKSDNPMDIQLNIHAIRN